MYRLAGEARTQVKEANSNKVARPREVHLTQHVITKTSNKGRKQCLYIQIVKK